MNPTAELADIVLPVASAWEREALRVGFEVSQAAEGLVQLRQPVVAPRGEARPDSDIIFELAQRLGLGSHFWNGDLDGGAGGFGGGGGSVTAGGGGGGFGAGGDIFVQQGGTLTVEG